MTGHFREIWNWLITINDIELNKQELNQYKAESAVWTVH